MEAVLFDMDGLLVDTEKVWYAVETEVVESLGGTWGRAHQQELVGGSMASTAAYIVKVTGTDVGADVVAARMLAGMTSRLAEGVDLMPGADELLTAVREAGVRTGLVTSSASAIAGAVLDVVGRERFDVVVTGDDVARPKPDPEPYLLAARLLGVPPGSCVVLEDSPNGVTAATAAGCRVVAVPSVLPIPDAPGRLVAGSLLKVTVERLRGLFADV
ncbi:HAD family phosphatase [Thermopolyspora sp. NPDC052614]|uniref:HAD family hydrolase n=1 Tax=Thermopolyspora sp. NPDC052614 TaxID=3155682 RepID=UPI0034257029